MDGSSVVIREEGISLAGGNSTWILSTEGLGSWERSLKFIFRRAFSARLKIWILFLTQQLSLPPKLASYSQVQLPATHPQAARDSLLQVHSLILTLSWETVLFYVENCLSVQKKQGILFGARGLYCVQTKTETWTGMFLPGPAYFRTPSSAIYIMALCTAPSGVGQSVM